MADAQLTQSQVQSLLLLLSSLQSGQPVAGQWDEDFRALPVVANRGRDKLEFMARGLLAGTATTVFTCPTGESWTDIVIVAARTDTTDRTFQLHYVPLGGSQADSNIVMGAGSPLNAASPTQLMYGLGCQSGDFFSGLCSTASKVNITLWGVRV